ncbi:MAG: SDR family oxidoreductase [Desulfobacterales bacterium]|nr:SDR family oxidoreductase [Desulfobacterales bacterium]
MVDFSLTGKIALITGASRGIGESIAKALAAQGAQCILVSRKPEGLDKVAEEIRKEGGMAETMACHMGYLDQIQALFDNVKERFGKLHILINNAATNPHFGELTTAEEGHWDKIMDVNLKGPFFMIQKAVPLLEAAGGGAVMNVSSINGVSPAFLQGVYSISKAGIISMTKAYAKELAPKNIRVNALLPGMTDTKFSQAILGNKEIHDYVIQQIPMGRAAQPDEMAGAALYMVSDAASYTTGACILCDGGMLA